MVDGNESELTGRLGAMMEHAPSIGDVSKAIGVGTAAIKFWGAAKPFAKKARQVVSNQMATVRVCHTSVAWPIFAPRLLGPTGMSGSHNQAMVWGAVASSGVSLLNLTAETLDIDEIVGESISHERSVVVVYGPMKVAKQPPSTHIPHGRLSTVYYRASKGASGNVPGGDLSQSGYPLVLGPREERRVHIAWSIDLKDHKFDRPMEIRLKFRRRGGIILDRMAGVLVYPPLQFENHVIRYDPVTGYPDWQVDSKQ